VKHRTLIFYIVLANPILAQEYTNTKKNALELGIEYRPAGKDLLSFYNYSSLNARLAWFHKLKCYNELALGSSIHAARNTSNADPFRQYTLNIGPKITFQPFNLTSVFVEPGLGFSFVYLKDTSIKSPCICINYGICTRFTRNICLTFHIGRLFYPANDYLEVILPRFQMGIGIQYNFDHTKDLLRFIL
jgi:hypothetical protein